MSAQIRGLDEMSSAFTHLHIGLPSSDRRVVLTAILADGTNTGLTRMADACAVASYRQLAWNGGWHLREDTYRGSTAIANAQHAQPLAALFSERPAYPVLTARPFPWRGATRP